jgi:hypothetical protein
MPLGRGAGALLAVFAAVLALLPACRCSAPRRLSSGKGPAVVIVDPRDDKAALAEKEPNNQLEQATPLPASEVLEGKLDALGDVDWYRVEVSKAGILSATLRGVPQQDLVLEAYSKAGKRLVLVDNARAGGGEVLANLAVTAGSYYLKIALVKPRKPRKRRRGKTADKKAPERIGSAKQLAGAGRYRLAFAVRDAIVGEEREPNWSRSRASELELGAEVTGYFGWKTDSDWYRVDLTKLEKGALLRIELDVPEQVWAYLALRDGRGRLIQRRLGTPGETLVLANLQPPSDAQQVYVVARTGKTANVDTRYSLRIEQELKRDCEIEPNGKPARATLLPAKKTLSGVMTDRRDRDVFAVAVSSPSLLELKVTPSWRLDVAVALVDEKGKPIYELDARGLGQVEVIPSVLVKPPRAYVCVRVKKASSADETGTYQIVGQITSAAAHEHEPNHKQELASVWNPGVAELTGHLYPAGDEDWFLMQASAAFSVTATAQAPIQLKLRLVNSEGKVERVANAKAPGDAVTIAAPPSVDNKWWLVVSGGGEDYRHTYRLKRESKVAPLPTVP